MAVKVRQRPLPTPVLGNIRLDRSRPVTYQALTRRKLAATTVNKTLKQIRPILRTAELSPFGGSYKPCRVARTIEVCCV